MMALPNDLCEVLIVYTHLPTSRETLPIYNVVSKDRKSNQFHNLGEICILKLKVIKRSCSLGKAGWSMRRMEN